MSVGVGVRHHQLIAQAEVERQLRTLLPVVFDVRVERSAAQLAGAADLQRGLLGGAGQKVGEGGAGVQAGERECARRVDVELIRVAVDPVVRADPHLMLRERMRPDIARGDPCVGPEGCWRALKSGEASRDRQARHAPILRARRSAGRIVDARGSADVLHVREAVRRLGAGTRDVDAEIVDEPVANDVDGNRHRDTRICRMAPEVRKHAQRIGLVVTVLELRLQGHARAAAACTSAKSAATASEAAAASGKATATVRLHGRRQVLRQPQAETIATTSSPSSTRDNSGRCSACRGRSAAE